MMYQKQALENYSITISALKGISSSPPWLLLCDKPPKHVLRHFRSAQGRYGGTGTVPSFIVPEL